MLERAFWTNTSSIETRAWRRILSGETSISIAPCATGCASTEPASKIAQTINPNLERSGLTRGLCGALAMHVKRIVMRIHFRRAFEESLALPEITVRRRNHARVKKEVPVFRSQGECL